MGIDRPIKCCHTTSRKYRNILKLLYIISVTLGLSWTAHAQQSADSVAPEAGGAGEVVTSDEVARSLEDKAAGRPVKADDWMVVAANPLAVEAGARVLREGGTAADAMVGVQAVLGLVEPQSSGLGGGAFLVWWDAGSGTLTTLDGRETAPLAATPLLFQTAEGEPLGFFEAVVGGLSVGTPATPALMEEAHRRWGRAAWPGLFDEAIAHARDGFKVSERMSSSIARDAERLGRFPETAAYFLPGGMPLRTGDHLRNPAYAATLEQLAEEGSAAVYTGDIARDIVATVTGAADNPGVLAEIDLALYQVKERDPVCAPYRGYDICGMGPPSSGALAVGQTLGALEAFDLRAMGPESPQAWRLIGDASRLAFADRGRYVADEDHVPVPVAGMVDPSYLETRGKLLNGARALHEAPVGAPEFEHALNWADDASRALPSTSHISIVDSYGNALAMTTTIENAFGSRLFVRGFLLNNELTDFSFRTHRGGLPIANSVAPGKRPRSSMSPTIVMRDGTPVIVLGSPGGSRIIPYVSKTLVAMIDWDLNAQEAVAYPHLVNRFGTYDIESDTSATRLEPELRWLGFETAVRDLNSGLHVIDMRDGLEGGADPRREGVALGE
ncbi:gamma-glutamyltransferase [Roseovarius sp. E0-M6]|uniref:gamma-glutamyltransferase n=1 Tax=Roseovarius sp. E0-M6 TaxID=3127118 RepID=UPI003FA71A54